MTTQTYRELCEAVKLISDAADRYSDGEPFLDEWRKWARGFLSGLYYSKTAHRAEQSALAAANGRRGGNSLVITARAAALAATSVVHAAQHDDDAARAKAEVARNMIEVVNLQCGRSGNFRVEPSAILKAMPVRPNQHV